MNSAARAATSKHEVLSEFRDSVYYLSGSDEPTLLAHPGVAFKRALGSAALRAPGLFRTVVEQLTLVPPHRIPVWGIPVLGMFVVRLAGAERTPDVRSKAVLPRWAAIVPVRFFTPQLRAQTVMNLLSNAGQIVGIGDGRPEKGKLSFGRFRICNDDDPEFLEIQRTGARVAQQEAMLHPGFFDPESEELFTWYQADRKQRGFAPDETVPWDDVQVAEVLRRNGPRPVVEVEP